MEKANGVKHSLSVMGIPFSKISVEPFYRLFDLSNDMRLSIDEQISVL